MDDCIERHRHPAWWIAEGIGSVKMPIYLAWKRRQTYLGDRASSTPTPKIFQVWLNMGICFWSRILIHLSTPPPFHTHTLTLTLTKHYMMPTLQLFTLRSISEYKRNCISLFYCLYNPLSYFSEHFCKIILSTS